MRSIWAVGKKIAIIVLFMFFVQSIVEAAAFALPATSWHQIEMKEWQVSQLAEQSSKFDSEFVMKLYEQAVRRGNDWDDIPTNTNKTLPTNIDDHYTVLRLQLPSDQYLQPAILFKEIHSAHIAIIVDGQLRELKMYNYPQIERSFLLALDEVDMGQMLYIVVNNSGEHLWELTDVVVGELSDLQLMYLKQGSINIIIGFALLFIGVVVFMCALFIHKNIRSSWYALSVLIISLSVMFVAESAYMYTIWNDIGYVINYISKIAASIGVLTLIYFIQTLWGEGPGRMIDRVKKIQMFITIFHFAWLLLAFVFPNAMEIYNEYSRFIITLQLVFASVFFFSFSIYLLRMKKKVGWILISGVTVFTLTGIVEVSIYTLIDRNYSFNYWQWSSIFFMLTLIIVLVKQALANYEQVLRYSQKLERLNTDLQRAEKMEIISQLAASVAHEVRNPLQITRGFLQLLMHSPSTEKKVSYMELAISELDRANGIISDFLGFAKPQVEGQSMLIVDEELEQIRAIIHPLVVIHGNQLRIRLEPNLFVMGNSSAFKQAIINLIKNAIEATEKEGQISIHAYQVTEKNKVVVTIEDNGEGMSETDLKNLGEPFYSQKSKGTGLGITITYNIIEAMGGLIYYTSKLGVGTTVKVELPLAKQGTALK
ncbi:ATP-binding protein [Paenibacillus yanchengensis]|uniref:histidine kinase n=1 Tax=Paenibacillus yanchengensis TaxID=2035833 RepID=A0ABW4YGY1_9BACL